MIYNKVILTYDIELLIDSIQLRSIYATQSTDITNSITDAEKDILNYSLRDAANDLYQNLQSLTRKSDTPFLYDFFNTLTQKRTIVYELWMNENWDISLKSMLYAAGQKLMVNYVLKDWFTTIGQQIPAQVSISGYMEAEKDIRNTIDSRKTPTRRPPSYF